MMQTIPEKGKPGMAMMQARDSPHRRNLAGYGTHEITV
jgi:hypothetical protein